MGAPAGDAVGVASAQPGMADGPHPAGKAALAKAERDQLFSEMLKDVQFWYRHGESISRFAMELVSANPGQVNTVCETLVRSLAVGPMSSEAACLQVADRTFETRGEIKDECRELLSRYVGPVSEVVEDVGREVQMSHQDMAFMGELIKHHPRGAEKSRGCIRVAAGVHPEKRFPCFLLIRADGTREDFSYVRCVENAPTQGARAQAAVCDSLCMILQLHPAACGAVAKMLDQHFPKYRVDGGGPGEVYRNWTRSLLRLGTTISALTDYVLGLLIRKMIAMDVEIAKVEDELEDTQGRAPDDKLDLMAQILDVMMLCLFEFLEVHLSRPGNEQVTPMEGRLVASMMEVFRGTILLTHQCRFVQFLFFYMASLRPNWTEAVLSCCLTSVFSPNEPMQKRLISGAYLASFVSRASFLTPQYSLRTAQYLSQFAREQVQAVEGLVAAGSLRNRRVLFFLSIVQAMCYLLCFKAASFAREVDPASGLTALQRILPSGTGDADAFTPVLESACRPITLINVNVARQLCRTIRCSCPSLAQQLKQQLAWHHQTARARCNSADTELEAATADDEPEEAAPLPGLELFFPFDPYRLRNSHVFVSDIYAEWEEEDGESSDVDDFGTFADTFRQRGHLGSMSPSPSPRGGHAAMDFVETLEAAERGFVPSAEPSPAFGPRSADVMMEPMEGVEDDGFELPSACIDTDNPVLQALTSSQSYRSGVAY